MGSKQRRDRERGEVKTKIMNAARDLFATQGVEAVSMRKIADAMEYSPTVIYAYFKDKEALIREICNDDFRALAAIFGQIATVTDPIERIRQIGAAYAKFAIENPNHYRLMFMTPKGALGKCEDEDMSSKGNPDEDGYAFLRNCVTDALQAGRFATHFTDADLISQTFWAAVHGVVSLQIAKCNDAWITWAPLDQRISVMIDSIIVGLTRNKAAT